MMTARWPAQDADSAADSLYCVRVTAAERVDQAGTTAGREFQMIRDSCNWHGKDDRRKQETFSDSSIGLKNAVRMYAKFFNGESVGSYTLAKRYGLIICWDVCMK